VTSTAVRDFVHVADMATAFALALHACDRGSGAPTTSAAATPAPYMTSLPVGAELVSTLCNLGVFVDQPAEQIAMSG
jgi:hypothetical protein